MSLPIPASPPVPLNWFVRRKFRERGSGYLDCPNCHEHALQDVVDEMTFLCLPVLRLSPIHRRRVLLCRRCGFRRKAAQEEMSRLETSGRPIRHAWLAPIGLLCIGIPLGGVAYVAGHTPTADTGINFAQAGCEPISSCTFDLPVEYNLSADRDVCPNIVTMTNSSRTLVIRLRRILDPSPAAALLAAHLQDDASLFGDTNFPLKVPAKDVTDVTVAGQKAKRLQFDYKHTSDNAEMVIYALDHSGVGYTVSFQALGAPEIGVYPVIEKRFISTLSLQGAKETPAPALKPGQQIADSCHRSSSSPSSSSSPTPATSPTP